jgi:hypothetical protein
MARKPRSKIERQIPPVGTLLTGKFFGKEHHAIVVADAKFPEGRAVKYHGILYGSLTGAAKAITKQPTNGWRFWRFETQG